MHARSANVSPARCHRLRLHTGRSISTSQDQRTLARRATVFHSTKSLDDGAIAVPSNVLYQHGQLSLLLHLLSRSNQTLGRASPHTTRPIRPVSCLSRLHPSKHPRDRLRIAPAGSQQSGSTRCHLCLSCTCACGDDQGSVRSAHPSFARIRGLESFPCTRSGCSANPHCRATPEESVSEYSTLL